MGCVIGLIIGCAYDRVIISDSLNWIKYDLCGNRLKKLDKSGTEEYHYNRKNQLICRFSEKDKTAYCYDKQGNLLEAAGAEGIAVFSYNAFHQQTAMTMLEGKRLENRYDAEYLHAGTVENGTVTTFSYHNGELLAESSPDGDTISRYIPGYGVAAGWNREKSGYHYYHLDEQNSTAYITGRGGEIENRYEYDAFGVLKNSMEEFHNRILYTGQQYDQTSGQYYLRARFYNPVLGRFVQEDEYRGDGLNLYAYCKNNPVVYYDPSGYKKEAAGNCKNSDQQEESPGKVKDSRVGVGVTEGGMSRTSKEWRDKYGPNASREHHLIPQELAKPDTAFYKQMQNLGIKDVQEYIDKHIAILPNGHHIDIHTNKAVTSSGKVYDEGMGWNYDWKAWGEENPDFSLADLEDQIKVMMKNYNIPKSSRAAKKYGRN